MICHSVFRLTNFCKPINEIMNIFQELRDISSMAMEHFDDKIVPGKNVHCNLFFRLLD